jgi:hypothetical protein
MVTEKKFKFNLVTPITKEEIETIEERDNTVVNSVLLIFVAVFVFSALSLLTALFIEPAVANSALALRSKEVSLTKFDEVKKLNGEFVIKSRALSPLLDLDIKPDKLVAIVDNLVSALSAELDIASFGRDKTGDFKITAYVKNLDSLDLIQEFFRENEESVDNLFITQLSNISGLIFVSISFDILV